MDLSSFGTPEFPLRASHLRVLLACPWREVMVTMSLDTDPSGQAADTGSACHAAVAEFHRTGDEVAGMDAMAARIAEYPAADLEEAAKLFFRYLAEPANRGARLLLVEHTFVLRLAPSPLDPTGTPVTVQGTVDQVRDADVPETWDLKTSRDRRTAADADVQLALYTLGAEQVLGRPCAPGGLVMPRFDPQLVPAPWGREDVEAILAPVLDAVALVRMGRVAHVPNAVNCAWCHCSRGGQHGPTLCRSAMRRLGKTIPLHVLRT